MERNDIIDISEIHDGGEGGLSLVYDPKYHIKNLLDIRKELFTRSKNQLCEVILYRLETGTDNIFYSMPVWALIKQIEYRVEQFLTDQSTKSRIVFYPNMGDAFADEEYNKFIKMYAEVMEYFKERVSCIIGKIDQIFRSGVADTPLFEGLNNYILENRYALFQILEQCSDRMLRLENKFGVEELIKIGFEVGSEDFLVYFGLIEDVLEVTERVMDDLLNWIKGRI